MVSGVQILRKQKPSKTTKNQRLSSWIFPFFFGPDLLQQNAPDADRNRFLQPMAPPWHRGFC